MRPQDLILVSAAAFVVGFVVSQLLHDRAEQEIHKSLDFYRRFADYTENVLLDLERESHKLSDEAHQDILHLRKLLHMKMPANVLQLPVKK